MAQFKYEYKVGDLIYRDHEFGFGDDGYDSFGHGEGPFEVVEVVRVDPECEQIVAHTQALRLKGVPQWDEKSHWISAAWFKPSMRTQQEIFDFVYEKLMEQGKQSISGSGDGQCMYRGIGTAKCAIGHLIPDDLYKPHFETDVGTLMYKLQSSIRDHRPSNREDYIALAKAVPELIEETNRRFFVQLQIAHDRARSDDFPQSYTTRMRNLAQEFNLTWNHD